MIRPLNDFVFIRRVDAETTTTGGLYVPDSAKEKQAIGIIVAVGPGWLTKDGKRVPLGVEKGEKVAFAKHAGQEFDHEGERLLVVKGQDLLAAIAGE